MSRVFVVQNHLMKNGHGKLVPRFNLEPAEKFGELVFLLSPSAKPFSPVIPELHRRLHDFNSDDSLLLIGNPALIAFAFAVASHYNGEVAVLQWSGKNQDYLRIVANPREGAIDV